MDPDRLKKLAQAVGDPEIIDRMEIRVTIDMHLEDQQARWLAIQASPEIVAAMLEPMVPALKKLKETIKLNVEFYKS